MDGASKPGLRNLITDVPGLKVGNSHDNFIKTGSTAPGSSTPR